MSKEKSDSTNSVDRVVHTPGPWRLIDGKSEVVAEDCLHIAFVKANFTEHVETQRKNAELIADAPKMLELIRELHDFAEPMRHWEYAERGRQAFRDAAILLGKHGG